MKELLGDVKYALRGLARRRVFTTVVLLTLGLGIGINTTVYTLTNSLLFRPLPFPESDRIAIVASTLEKMGWTAASASIPEMEDVRQRSKLLQGVAYFASSANPTFSGSDGMPERLFANFVHSSYFSVLRARPELGRTFIAAEDQGPGGGNPVVILSHGFWKNRLGGKPDIIGSKISLNDVLYTVVGVMPADFRDIRNDFEQTDVWMPLSMGIPFYGSQMFETRSGRRYLGLVKLKEGVSLSQAQAEIDEIARQLRDEYPYAHDGRGLRLIPPYEWYYDKLEGPAKVLAIGAALVLLLCCVNIATLLLVRGRARLREIAVRVALGAARAQLIRQILVESFVLALLGGALGLLLAWWAVKLLLGLGGLDLPPFAEIEFDSRVMLFSLLLTFATGMLFGLLPAWQLARTDLRDSLHPTAYLAGKRGASRRSLIAVAEVALAAVLLIGAGLTVKSLYRLINTQLGFETDNLLTMQVQVNDERYADLQEPGPLRLFSENLLRDLNAIPGVEHAVLWGPSMIGEARFHSRISPMGMAPDDPQGRMMVQRLHVSPGALRALGIPLLQGRDFTPAERLDGPPYYTIVDQRLANKLWPGENAVGKRLYRGEILDNEGIVIGVAANVLHRGRTRSQEEVIGDMYVSFLQEPVPAMSILLRHQGDPASTLAAVRRVLVRHGSDLAPYDVASMGERLARVEAAPRLNATLLSLYGLVAIILAILGIYGVLAYSVQQRGPEMAVRSTFGALPQDLLWMVIRQGMLSAVLGLVIGLGTAIALSKYLESLLYQVSRTDLVMYGGVALLLTLTAFAACYLPARRASLINPLEALRTGE
jgi:putative ABC transport system permease protein